jgi:2-(1,2-epoxy-1,2-dihydrophenyl)acetyl-CoA isomerase
VVTVVTGRASPKLLVDDTAEGVRLLTLNDPRRRNAVDPEMMDALVAAVGEVASRPDLRALVITGAGSAFCSGAAIHSLSGVLRGGDEDAANPATARRVLDPVHPGRHQATQGPPVVAMLADLAKPSFAAVNGHAYGLGLGLALACDFRIAGAGARFNAAFIRSALVPGDGSAWKLPRLVGTSRALWLLLSAETLGAAEAHRIGLVDRMVPDDELLASTLASASALARGPQLATVLTKHLVYRGEDQELAEHLAMASRAQELARASDEYDAAVRAFTDKRRPGGYLRD